MPSTPVTSDDTPTGYLPAMPQPIRHAGPCGRRIPCPVHGMALGPNYSPAERMRNGDVLAHDCGRVWRRSELPQVAA